ncbi:flagellar basal body rod protein FlgC [Saccharibacillus sp. CPCC 101409]|uniref:flagellar basal body rod protein FlgC n=1 Tax=Saccharibacillus sp. CPCC 101409 TaxID=3058041 RepID=UPI0026734B14|nr:flagellar basal body rod protein FlgC [Saccharibacillus sp. CPCC 101409]MDO3410706.1 flagellar basal body rod protein FlgC [Saccharibacillus sp. CPCC 101409]
MRISSGFDVNASALTAQRLRMDVISSNIANADTTRASIVDGKAEPYRRKVTVLSENNQSPFAQTLNKAMNGKNAASGVKVTGIQEDQEPFKQVYNPTHPDADANGYVQMPNVDIAKEMVDMISATRSYEANVTALNATKSMISKALQIGK